ncbi:MAG: transcription elongation factor GreA [Oscillospiraceae bacterium]|jgi:transcription elongation factor GreA|nr:transcription elongation factor GreA [Oscillospiraceae bacterium]
MKEISRTGYEKLQKELAAKKVELREVAEKIKEARGHGDLSENAEYDSAKEEQGKIKQRIDEITIELEESVIIEEVATDYVGMNSVFEVKSLNDGKVIKWKIVAPNEIDIPKGFISNESPIGSAAMRKKIGEVFTATTPRGDKQFEVISIMAE